VFDSQLKYGPHIKEEFVDVSTVLSDSNDSDNDCGVKKLKQVDEVMFNHREDSGNIRFYDSKEELALSLKKEYMAKGVALTIKRSNSSGLVLKCDLGGECSSKVDTPKRNKGSRLSGCPFEIRGGVKNGKWFLRQVIGDHNHKITGNLNGHAVARRMNDAEVARVTELSASGVSTKEILTICNSEFTDATRCYRDIYNIIQKINVDFLACRSPLEALLDLLQTEDYISNVWVQNDTVIGVFFAYKPILSLTKAQSTRRYVSNKHVQYSFVEHRRHLQHVPIIQCCSGIFTRREGKILQMGSGAVCANRHTPGASDR
jgi:hypothetical protein